VAFVLAPLGELTQPVLAQGTNCSYSSPGSGIYTVTICFTNPLNDSSLTGDVNVRVQVSVSGTNPSLQKVIFYLNNAYVITDYQTPYSFSLPTTYWTDGSYTLSVEALMRDNFITPRTNLSVNFTNGTSSLPVNNRQFQPASGTLPQNGAPFVVAAVGDGASGESNAVDVTALLSKLNPNLLLYLGDVYEKGSKTEFYNWYGSQGKNFARFLPITNPTIGNHEYENGAALGYFEYWDNVPNYYSFDAGGWHFISLNSNARYSPVSPQSAQYQWLEKDLKDHDQACTIVYYHHPLFNIGTEGSTNSMWSIWPLLAEHGVSIVINGHDHTYQRWVSLDSSGQPSPTGITEFIAGASGHGIQALKRTDSRVAYSTDDNPVGFGALLLTLNPGGVAFNYKNINGTNLDSGVVPCLKFGLDTESPNTPTGFSALASNPTQVNMKWVGSSDKTGVNGYTIYRDGSVLVTLSGIDLSYIDGTALPSTTYQYTVDAFDLAGNHSDQSTPYSLTTLDMPPHLTFPVEADTYVSASSPTANYGTATALRLDGSPVLHTFLRFNVQGLGKTPITRARLMVYTNNNSNIGFSAMTVPDNGWDETEVNNINAPTMGNFLHSSGAIKAESWVTLDVTPYVTGEGTYSFGLTTPGSTTLSFQSREMGLNSAQLVLDLQNNIPDTQPPAVPAGLTAKAGGPTQVNLNWKGSTDNLSVTGYTIFRNGTKLNTVSGSTLTYVDNSVRPETTYSYTVEANDLAGNHSAISAKAPLTTPGMPGSLIFTPIADTYVNAANPDTNYGSSTALRVDASPDLHSYLRFDVKGLGGMPIKKARLLFYATSFSTKGLNVQAVSTSTWGENVTNYNNAPAAMSATIASSPPVSAGTWIELIVTPSVTGEGLYNFSVSTPGLTAIRFASRESGSYSPQLIIDLR